MHLASRCRESQTEILRELLALNAESRFSRKHGLHAGLTPEEFARRMPVVDDDFFRPSIEFLKAGDQAALLGANQRLMMFALTSGTTAAAKYIPITEKFLNDYRRGWQIWGIHAFDDHPRLHLLNIFQLSSDHDQFRTPGGTPCGNISGLVGTIQSRAVKLLYTLPIEVAKIHQAEAKYYTALRIGLADEYVGQVMTANPSTLARLAKLADEHKSSLIRDLYEGTLTLPHSGPRASDREQSDVIPPSICNALGRYTKRRRRERARQLDRIVEKTGKLLPRDFWPRLQLIAVWTGGSAGAYLHQLKEYYGDVAVRDHGLSASEGRMTIPFADGTATGLLDVGTHYFEFIPEAEHESNHPVVLRAHELEVDQNYYILLTTSSGLYRYDIRDVVRCVGFHESTPCLEFLHKGAHIANITGEKISESQVIGAVKTAFQRFDQHLECFALAPQWSDPPGYRLLMESRHLPSKETIDRLADEIDRLLQVANDEYREKRQTGRLTPVRFLPIADDSWNRFIAKRQSAMKGNVEQYKQPCLLTDLQAINEFTPSGGESGGE